MCEHTLAFAQGVTDENDLSFLRTLSLLKGRDKRIYKPKVMFYASEGGSVHKRLGASCVCLRSDLDSVLEETLVVCLQMLCSG